MRPIHLRSIVCGLLCTLAFVPSLFSANAASPSEELRKYGPGFVTRTLRVYSSRQSDYLLKHTDIRASLTDSEGRPTERPTHLLVMNGTRHTVYVSGPLLRRADEVPPGEDWLIYITVDHEKGKPLSSIEVTFKFWTNRKLQN